MKILRNFFRILVGLVFVFSGFVKGIDPLGTVYRMDDYFLAFNLPWASAFSLYLTIFLCTLEFILGVSLLFNLWIRKTAWILLPMMVFFTILTFFDAFYNIVPDCGCFGDALKLTNLQTFIKNLVLIGLVIPVFIWRKKFRSLLPQVGEVGILLLAVFTFASLSIYCYTHLPLIDFMAWKVGNRVNDTKTLPVQFYVTYKNKNTGEEKEYIAPNYPWNDSVWLSKWIFKGQRVVDPNKNQGLVLRAEDAMGNDYTSGILNNPDYQFILVSYNLSDAYIPGFNKILPVYNQAVKKGLSFVCLTNSLPEEIRKFKIAHGLGFDFYNSDDVVLKTMVRSNPGLLLLKNGVVVEKWSWRKFPDREEISTRFP
ncbi:MAG: DoxX family protein [Bacteroidales bacterium]|nr:DoxX family protein [Bacteroidales bacterium]MDD4603026.1 DoxX family protein [Bacteroidales bacterium]